MTREQAVQLWPIIKAFGEGKTIQYAENGNWDNLGDGLYFDDASSNYRIKPEPHLRPWKPEEVPVGSVVRNKATYNTYLIVGRWVEGKDCVMLAGDAFYNCEIMLSKYEHSLDHGKTWLPCGVEE